MDHKKTFTNTVAKKGHGNLKSEFSCLIASAEFQSAMGSISLSNIGGKLSEIVFEYLCLIYPVMVYYLSVQRNVWDMELLLWRGWFLSYIVVFQLSRYQKICYKALLWWVSRWKNDCLLKWGDWGPIFFFGRSTEFVKGLLQQKGCVEKWVWAWQRTESGDDVKPYIFSTTFS